MEKTPVSKYKVFLGITKQYSGNVKLQHDIEKYVWHPDYNFHYDPETNSTTAHHDFAIVKLKKSISFTDKINPACLPDPNQKYEGVEGIVSGWGLTNGSSIRGQKILQLVSRTSFFSTQIE